MKKRMKASQSQRNLTFCVVGICFLSLLVGGFSYLSSVRKNLLNQAISNVLTVTQQQQNAFDNFISRDRERIHSYAMDFARYDSHDIEGIQEKLSAFSEVGAIYSVVNQENGVYCNNKEKIAYQMRPGELEVYAKLEGSGVRDLYRGLYWETEMFGYYECFTFADGARGLFQKGYDSTRISSEFSLSFYNDQGYAYVVDQQGDILLRPDIEDSYDAGDNIFHGTNKDDKTQAEIDELISAMERQESGVAFLYSGTEEYVYTYVPVENVESWYLISVVREEAIMEEAETVVSDSQTVMLILALGLIIAAGFVYLIWRNRDSMRRKDLQIAYQEELFNVFFSHLSNDTNDIYLMLDKETCEAEYISPNVERILGIPAGEILNDVRALCISRENLARHVAREELEGLKPGQRLDPIEAERFHRRTGQHKWFLETGYCVLVQGTEKIIACLSDRTTERETMDTLSDALETAKIASKAKSTFLSSVSHDIRTPMNAIMGLTALLYDEAESPDHVREYTQKIDAASQHLLGLINDVLDMNKIESGSTSLHISEINIAEIIDELNTIIRPQTKAKKQTFEIFTSPFTHEHLQGDKLRINQILINILSNAVKYTQEGGQIVMTVRELPQRRKKYSSLQFSVKDNGQGMSQEYLDVIFDPFTREQKTTTNKIQGTGLGMAITKSLVDLMGGTVRVESAEGEGSTFIVELDLRIQEKENDPQFWTNNGVGRMIVADDDEDVCENIVHIMTETGVKVDYETHGKNVISTIRKAREGGKPYDLILLDWKMPDLDGLETARLIQKNYPEKIPILLFTAYDWSEIEQEALEVGIDHFLPKPFFMTSFKNAVAQVMGKRKTERLNQNVEKDESPLKGMHLMAAEDIEINRMILSKILATRGATCEVAEDGQKALEMFETSEPGHFDMILMDIQMPNLDGYEATRRIRASAHPSAKKVPIVAMTANAFTEDVQNALDAGMDGHIAKPITVKQLETTIREIMGRFPKEAAEPEPEEIRQESEEEEEGIGMGFFQELEALGVDVSDALDRVMGDEGLYKMMLGIFVDTVKEQPLSLSDFAEGQFERLEGQIHMLKGTTGNLSISLLYEGYTNALGLLRNGKPEEAEAILEKLLPAQEKIIACIEKHRDEC